MDRARVRTWGLVAALATFVALMMVDATVAEARRGGSFGGRRGGGYSSGRSSSSYGSRSTTPRTTSRTTTATRPRTSFGGTRLSSPTQYTRSYGVPRATQRVSAPAMSGRGTSNYVVHNYGGMGDRFMMGYLMGSTSWMWSMPFHPAFYYGRPQYYTAPDGSTSVYPGRFQWGTLIITLVVVGGVSYLIYRAVRSRRRGVTVGGPKGSFT